MGIRARATSASADGRVRRGGGRRDGVDDLRPHAREFCAGANAAQGDARDHGAAAPSATAAARSEEDRTAARTHAGGKTEADTGQAQAIADPETAARETCTRAEGSEHSCR